MPDDSYEKNLGKEPKSGEEYKPKDRPEVLERPEARQETKETPEMTPQAEIQRERERLSQKAGDTQLTPQEGEEAKREKAKIEKLDSDGKLERLLYLARDKGVVFAVKVAQDLGDPYALDKLHDILAKDENYKKLKE